MDLENAERDFSEFASKNAAIDIKEQSKAMVEAAATLEGQVIAAKSELESLRRIYADGNTRVRATQARIDELERQHPDWCLIVELRYFMGLTGEETAEVLGIPLRTMQRQFGDARRWLMERLKPLSCGTKANATNL